MDSIAAPEIPIGSLSAEVFGFDAGQTYAVYSAPDVKSLRGAGGKSKVSTNDWVQVFGREGDWLLVQYDVEDKYYRIGYISAKAIPTGMTVPDLNLGNETAVTMDKVNVTDDPLGNQNMLTELSADSHVTKLGVMGDWSYIEGTKDNKLFRGFVPSSILSESTLSFLGIGVQPPAASWGLMVNQSKQFLFTMPWLALAPSLSIMLVVLAFNFLGDGLRDALDPYLESR